MSYCRARVKTKSGMVKFLQPCVDESHFTHQFYPSKTLQSVNKNPWKPTFLLIFEIIMHFSLRKVTPRKKGYSDFFSCPRTKMKNLSVALKTVKFSKKMLNRQMFEKRKKGAPKLFRLRRPFFRKIGRSILRKSSIEGGRSKTYFIPPPPMTG